MLTRRQVVVAAVCSPFVMRTSAEAVALPTSLEQKLAQHFAAAGTRGVFVAQRGSERFVSDAARADQVFLPASTFKIPHNLIALELGVVEDPDGEVFKWDGVARSIAAWNKDHTLRTAMQASAVPVYQQIARRIGAERMQAWLKRLDYGNQDISGGIDRFWLTGGLRITANQQIAFLDRFVRGDFEASERNMARARDLVVPSKLGNAVMRSKTGLVGLDDTSKDSSAVSIGWLAGWVEHPVTPTIFALNLDVLKPEHTAQRMAIAQACLADIGAG